MRLIFALVCLISFTLAQSTINITSDTSSITNFKLDYFIDKTEKMNFEEVKSQKFMQGKNRVSLGNNVEDSWVRIKLLNKTDKTQILYLHQDRAYFFNN